MEKLNVFTPEEMKILIYLVRNRLRYEAKRPSYRGREGDDIQARKVWELKEIAEKLESMV